MYSIKLRERRDERRISVGDRQQRISIARSSSRYIYSPGFQISPCFSNPLSLPFRFRSMYRLIFSFNHFVVHGETRPLPSRSGSGGGGCLCFNKTRRNRTGKVCELRRFRVLCVKTDTNDAMMCMLNIKCGETVINYGYTNLKIIQAHMLAAIGVPKLFLDEL